MPGAQIREYGSDVVHALSAALARLPEAQRQVAVLKLVRGAPFAEIGEVLGVSEAAAKMRFVRALESLRTERSRMLSPWLTPGNEISGLTLASVSSTRSTAGPRTIDGIELQYGNGALFGGDGLVIDEQARPDDPRPWNHIPAGWISVQKGQGSDENNKTFDTWTGQLVKDGIYVTIETGAGEDALLATARALQRAP